MFMAEDSLDHLLDGGGCLLRVEVRTRLDAMDHLVKVARAVVVPAQRLSAPLFPVQSQRRERASTA